MDRDNYIVGLDDPILVTGAGGFIGKRLVEVLLRYGFTNLRCFARASGDNVRALAAKYPSARIELMEGNLLYREDCDRAVRDVKVIYHLVAGKDKSFANCVLNGVVTT